MIMWAMSDRTIPRSLRMMEGFGVHTFRLLNDDGRSRPSSSSTGGPSSALQSTCWDEAVKIAGADPDYHRRDLFEAIAAGDFPEWEFGVQLLSQKQADALPFDILDATKLIPEELLPIRIVGRMVLDRNPDNFFAETEQVAFLPTNMPPGIDFSEDPLLQGRLFSYQDTQLSRLGTVNFHQIPINRAKGCPFQNLQRDGHMQTQCSRAAPTTSPTAWPRPARTAGRARSEGRLPQLRSAARRDQGAPARGELRRPLQPGAAVLPLADRDRAGPSCQRAGVRAVEGDASSTCATACWPTCATSTRPGRSASPMASTWRCRENRKPAVEPQDMKPRRRCASSASIRRRWKGGRWHPRHRRRRRRDRQGREEARRRRRRHASRSSRRRSAA